MSSPPEKADPADASALPKVPSRHKRPALHPTRSAKVNCLRCAKPFVSWDRRCNRLCPVCAKKTS